MKKFFLALSFLVCLGAVRAAGFTVKITVNGHALQPVMLTDFYGDKNAVLDTVLADASGIASFKLPANQHPGMYKLVFKDDKYVDFIFNKENVELRADIRDLASTITAVSPGENELYLGYVKQQARAKTKLDLLQQMLDKFPRDDAFFGTIVLEYNKERAATLHHEDSICKANAGTLAARIIRVKAELVPSPDLDAYGKLAYKKSHWFDNTDFADTALLYTGAYTTKIIEYLTMHVSKYYQPEQQVQVFKSAIDTILEKTGVSKKTHDFAVDFLLDGFEQMGNMPLVEYVATKYTEGQTCEHEGSETTLERKVLTYTKLKIGTDAPPFSAVAHDGREVTLDTYGKRAFILVFWATWCQHCQQTLPEIKQLFDARADKTFDMVTVSLDTSTQDWETYLRERDFRTTTNLCDTKSWDGQMATDYHVYSTPTILIIKDKKIIGRPYDMESLEKLLKEINVL